MVLVSDDHDIVAPGQRGDPLQIVAAEDPTSGVVRVAEEIGARPGLERARQPVEVQVPAVRGAPERDVDDAAPIFNDGRGERWIRGGVDDDAAARRVSQAQYLGEADRHIRHKKHPVGIDRPVEPGAREVGEGGGQPSGMRVAGVAALDGVDERPLDGRGERDIHLGHEGGQDIGGVHSPLLTAPRAQFGQRTVVERVRAL